MDCNFESKLKPTNSKVNGLKMANKPSTIHSTNSSALVKPRTMSAVNQLNSQGRPTSPKITKRVNSSGLVQPNSFVQPISRLNNNNNVHTPNRLNTNTAQQPKSSVIKKPTSTFHSSQPAKPFSINSSANRLTAPQSTSKLSNSRTSSSSSIIKTREPKKLVKDTISNSSFVPREKLEKLTKKHEELTNKYNRTSKIISRNELTVDALSCLINYMAVDLDAFENPNLKKRVDHLELVEQELQSNLTNLNAENEKVNNELMFERHRSQKEKENLLEMFEIEMKSAEKNYQDHLKTEQHKREKAEKDLLYLKQNLSKDKKIDFLNKEIESLKIVLELRENELKDLRYKLDRTFVDQDEISQLRNERDNLSLAKEQLEYSLNMKNEELKFVLHENTSLASLTSLTSTPLPNDRNNNVMKKRKNNVKKQKLNSNEKDEDTFLKPMNLHKDRFLKPTANLVDDKLISDYFDNDDEMNKSLDDHQDEQRIDEAFLQPVVDEVDFVKPLIDRPMSLDSSYDQNFKKPEMIDPFEPQSIDLIGKKMETSFNSGKQPIDDVSLNKPFKINSPITKSSNEKAFHRSSRNSSNRMSDLTEQCFTRLIDENRKETTSDDDVFVKPFDINEIKERCFAKPIEKERPTEEPVKTSQSQSMFSQESYIKTCQILNDENDEISIVRNKKLESVLDSGFCDS